MRTDTHLVELLEQHNERVRELENALKGLSDMYVSTWDVVGGGLMMMDSGLQRFEAAHKEARRVLGIELMEVDEEGELYPEHQAKDARAAESVIAPTASAPALSVEQKAALDLAMLNLETHGDDQLLAAVKPLIEYYERRQAARNVALTTAQIDAIRVRFRPDEMPSRGLVQRIAMLAAPPPHMQRKARLNMARDHKSPVGHLRERPASLQAGAMSVGDFGLAQEIDQRFECGVRHHLAERSVCDLVVNSTPLGRKLVDATGFINEVTEFRRGVEDSFGLRLGNGRIHARSYRQQTKKL